MEVRPAEKFRQKLAGFGIVIGQGQMLEDLEKNLIALSATDEKSFNLKFKNDYQAEDLAGKKARIKERRV